MAGGSQIVINDDGITISTGRRILYQAQQHKFEGGQKVSLELPSLPVPGQPYVLQFLAKNKDNQPMTNTPYFIFDEDGNMKKGTTNDNGLMSLKTTEESKNIATRIMLNEIEEAQDAYDEDENV